MTDNDPEFEAWLLDAVNQHSASRPRTMQRTLGPSSLGACREYIRATIAGDDGIPERPRGVDAALIGTAVGDYLEQVFADIYGARTQVPIEIALPRLGIKVAGHADAMFLDERTVIDLKSKNGLFEVRRDGPSLDNMIQISVYLVAAQQAGLLGSDAVARLVYYDRAGVDKTFYAVPITSEAAHQFVELAEQRLEDVFAVLDAGSQEESRWGLRDQSPSLCFFTQCPFRMACWGGEPEWVPDRIIEGTDETARVEEYITARATEKAAITAKANAKEDLRGIAGIATVAGQRWAVSWKNDERRIDVIPL